MKVIKNMSIKAKLIAIILATTLPVMLIGIWFEASISLKNMETGLSENSISLARNLAENSVGPITFSDKQGIQRIVQFVSVNESVTDVMVYDQTGNLFFRFHKSGIQLESNFKNTGFELENTTDWLHIYQPVMYENNKLGLIYLRVSRSNILQQMNRFVLEMILITLFLILISIIIATYLQQLISKPIANLVSITSSIGKTGNLNTPILYESTDELGQLYNAFDKFIQTIKNRENELQLANRKLIAGENRLKNVIESSFDGVAIIDSNNRLTFCNNAFLRMFNANFETLKEFRLNTLLSDNEMVDIIISNSSGLNDPTRSAIAEVIAKPIGKKQFTAEFTAVNIEIEGIQQHVITLHDVSDRKEIETDLLAQTELVKTSELQRTSYILGLAHDLKTPLNSIIGFSELIKDENVPTEKKQSFANFIDKSGRLLLHAINTILDIIRIESKQIKEETQTVPVNELITNIYDEFAYVAACRVPKIEFVCADLKPTESEFITIDSHRFKALFNYLLFHLFNQSTGNKINIGIEKLDNQVSFFVKSDINCFDKEQLAQFKQLSSSKIETIYQEQYLKNLDLILSIKSAELLGGKLSIDATDEAGTRFGFKLHSEHKEISKPNTQHKPEKTNGSENALILIAEDEELNFKLLEETLKPMKYKVLRAINGSQAVEMCRTNFDIQLVLMDVKMPIMDGYTATKLIREFNKDLPIIAQTAFALAGEREKSLEIGCTDFITKPIRPNNLFSTINKYI